MAINLPKPPQESLDALTSTLRTLGLSSESARVMPEEFRAESLGGSQPELPHQVYSLGLDDLRRGAGLNYARLVSWRYFVPSASTTVSTAEVNVDTSGGHNFAQLNSGPFGESTRETVNSLMSDPRLASQSYDLRLLRIPALYVTAIWLKSQTGQSDIVVPVAPTISLLRAGERYQARDFENVIRKVAQEKQTIPGPTSAA